MGEDDGVPLAFQLRYFFRQIDPDQARRAAECSNRLGRPIAFRAEFACKIFFAALYFPLYIRALPHQARDRYVRGLSGFFVARESPPWWPFCNRHANN